MYRSNMKKAASLANMIVLAMLVITLSMPSTAYTSPARFNNHSWTVTIPSAGRLLQFTEIPGGIAYIDLNDSSFSGELSYGVLGGLHLQRAKKRGDALVGTALFPDHFGGQREINVAGSVSPTDGRFRGLMMVDDGEPLDIEVDLNGGPTASTQIVVVVILSAAAVGAIACIVGNYAVNCGNRCSESCGEDGVESWSETCGSCKCECK